MASGWLPGGFRMVSGWLPDGFQMASRWVPNDFQTAPGWLSDGLGAVSELLPEYFLTDSEPLPKRFRAGKARPPNTNTAAPNEVKTNYRLTASMWPVVQEGRSIFQHGFRC